MAYLARNIDVDLLEWKESARRKPLLVRGARQVGKSWAIRHLGETFTHYLEINLEAEKDLCRLAAPRFAPERLRRGLHTGRRSAVILTFITLILQPCFSIDPYFRRAVQSQYFLQ